MDVRYVEYPHRDGPKDQRLSSFLLNIFFNFVRYQKYHSSKENTDERLASKRSLEQAEGLEA